MAAYAAFGAYAVVAAIFSAGRDQVWAIWAAFGYAVALLMLWRWPGRTGIAVLVSVALAVVAPLLWLSTAYPLEDGMDVIDRAATLLLHHGSPYLTAAQVTGWSSYQSLPSGDDPVRRAERGRTRRNGTGRPGG